MDLEIRKKNDFNHQVRLPIDLNDFVVNVSKELNCSKSEAIRSMIKACKEEFKKKGERI